MSDRPYPPASIQLEQDITRAINSHSRENYSNTPDFLLATFMMDCLAAAERMVTAREKWYENPPRSPASADAPKSKEPDQQKPGDLLSGKTQIILGNLAKETGGTGTPPVYSDSFLASTIVELVARLEKRLEAIESQSIVIPESIRLK